MRKAVMKTRFGKYARIRPTKNQADRNSKRARRAKDDCSRRWVFKRASATRFQIVSKRNIVATTTLKQ
jgi:hypothetical protein